jgi:hypothetical protein
MGFLDKLKKSSADVTDKARDLATEHGDKIDDGIDKVADTVDQKTGGKHSDKIDKAADTAKGLVDKLEDGGSTK